MAHDDFQAVSDAQAFGQLLRQKNGTMLAARAAEGHHQILEAALLIIADAGIDQREHSREKLVHAFLLVEVFDHRRVFAGESFEALLAAGIRQTTAIKHEAPAIARVILRQAAMKGKAEDAHDKVLRFGSEAVELFRGQHALKCFHERGQLDGQFRVVQQPAQVFQGVGHALQEMCFALVKAAKTVGAQGLQQADIDVGVVEVQEGIAVQIEKRGQPVEISVQKLLAELRRQVGFGVEQQRGDVVLQGTFAAALIVNEEWLPIPQNHVAGLEIAVEKVVAWRAQEEIGKTAEIVLQALLTEWNPGRAKEIVFEIVQIPRDGLAVEAGARIAGGIIQVAAGFDLETRQNGDDFAVDLNHWGSDVRTIAIF